MKGDRHKGTQDRQALPVGRPRSLSPVALRSILLHHQAGLSYQDIVRQLRNTCAVDTSRWTVRRVVLGLPPYEHRGHAKR